MGSDEFARYGRVLEPDAQPDHRHFTDAALECDGRPTLNVIWQPPQGRRFTCLERHSALTQGFVHLGGAAAVVCVAEPTESSPDAIPTPNSVRGFVVVPGMAYLFHRQTWHSLDRYLLGPEPCTFLILNSDPNPTQIVNYASGISELHRDLGKDLNPQIHRHAGSFGIEFEISDF